MIKDLVAEDEISNFEKRNKRRNLHKIKIHIHHQ